MAEMLLVNPRRRRKRRRGKRRMSALQRRYFGKKRSAPVRRRRRHRRRSAALGFSAPRRVSRRRHRRHRRMRVTRVRRNPSMRLGGFNLGSFLRNDLMPAGVGAIGAIGVDVALSYVTPMLPVSLQSGIGRTGVRIAGAVGVGWVAGMVMGRRFGEQVTAGALTVTLYDLIKGYAAQVLPGLSEYNMGWASPALSYNTGEYVGSDPYGSQLPGLSEYVGEYEPGGQYAYGA